MPDWFPGRCLGARLWNWGWAQITRPNEKRKNTFLCAQIGLRRSCRSSSISSSRGSSSRAVVTALSLPAEGCWGKEWWLSLALSLSLDGWRRAVPVGLMKAPLCWALSEIMVPLCGKSGSSWEWERHKLVSHSQSSLSFSVLACKKRDGLPLLELRRWREEKSRGV